MSDFVNFWSFGQIWVIWSDLADLRFWPDFENPRKNFSERSQKDTISENFLPLTPKQMFRGPKPEAALGLKNKAEGLFPLRKSGFGGF